MGRKSENQVRFMCAPVSIDIMLRPPGEVHSPTLLASMARWQWQRHNGQLSKSSRISERGGQARQASTTLALSVATTTLWGKWTSLTDGEEVNLGPMDITCEAYDTNDIVLMRGIACQLD